MLTSRLCKTKPKPRRSRQALMIQEWRDYQRIMSVPAPDEDRRFAAELQLRENKIALKEMAQFGDETTRRESWRAIARQGDEDDILLLGLLTGPVPMDWMSDSYYLYKPSTVKDLTIYNQLSALDNPAIADYIRTGTLPHEEDIVELIRIDPAAVYLPLEDVLVACVQVEEGREFSVKSLLSQRELENLAPLYGVPERLPFELMERLTLRVANDSSDPLHFFNANWVGYNAPWLVLRSSQELQLAFCQKYDCYRLQLAYGNKDDTDWLLERFDPTRLQLALHLGRKE